MNRQYFTTFQVKQVSQRALCRAVQDGVLLSDLPDLQLLLVKLIAETQANTCLSCPILCSTTPGVTRTLSTHAHRPHMHVVLMRMSSACCPHMHVICMSSAHVVCMCTCHLHIICSTPHGQRGPKLSFYFDRNWLLNGICRKNVELFHFRII